MKRKLFFLIVILALLAALVSFFQFSGVGTKLVWTWSRGGTLLLPLISVAALVDTVNPCAFSILILTIAFLMSIGKIRSKILFVGGAYIAGLFLVYILIGLGIVQALHIFNTPHFMARLGAALLIILGSINLINELFPQFPIKLKIPDAAHHKMAALMERASAPTAFALGGLVGLCEFPCTGGPYLMVLGLLHDQATYAKGLGYLLLYNSIFILPLVVILLIASNPLLIEKVRVWQRSESRSMRFWGGVAMVTLGALMFLL